MEQVLENHLARVGSEADLVSVAKADSPRPVAPEKPTTKVVTRRQKPVTKVVDLATCEARIEASWGKLIVVGRELDRIRQSGLPIPWGRYCRDRWKITKTAANYLIGQSRVGDHLKLDDDFPASRLRPLIGLTLEHQTQAWAAAKAMTKRGYHPSAAHVKIAAAKFTQKQLASWSLRSAHAILDRAVKRGIERALTGATEEEAKAFFDMLPSKLDHYQELYAYINPS
jgi:hypothetical protein